MYGRQFLKYSSRYAFYGSRQWLISVDRYVPAFFFPIKSTYLVHYTTILAIWNWFFIVYILNRLGVLENWKIVLYLNIMTTIPY